MSPLFFFAEFPTNSQWKSSTFTSTCSSFLWFNFHPLTIAESQKTSSIRESVAAATKPSSLSRSIFSNGSFLPRLLHRFPLNSFLPTTAHTLSPFVPARSSGPLFPNGGDGSHALIFFERSLCRLSVCEFADTLRANSWVAIPDRIAPFTAIRGRIPNCILATPDSTLLRCVRNPTKLNHKGEKNASLPDYFRTFHSSVRIFSI